MLTVVCHFYNESYLLPWWLMHHKRIFDHGIMIDYNSTDNSRDIIKDICPTWDIVTTRNKYFDSAAIDREVEYYEEQCSDWRMALNVTEFLYGNTFRLAEYIPTQHFIGNYVFVDEVNPTYERPLHEQITFGYEVTGNPCHVLNTGARAPRSVHNYAVKYPEHGGRHWDVQPTFDDLVIFYYGYAMLNEENIARKLQIRNKISPEEISQLGHSHPNIITREQYLHNINTYHRPKCKDISHKIQEIAKFNYSKYN